MVVVLFAFEIGETPLVCQCENEHSPVGPVKAAERPKLINAKALFVVRNGIRLMNDPYKAHYITPT